MIAIILATSAATAIAAWAICAAATLRTALGAIIAVGAAIIALALAIGLLGADQAATFAIAAGAVLMVVLIAAATLIPESAARARASIAPLALAGALAAALTFAMADAPSPFTGRLDPAIRADAMDGLIAAAVLCMGAAVAWALLATGERSALNAPTPAPGIAFPGREHAIARGVGKGLTPLVAVIAFALAPVGGLGAAFAGGALLGLAYALYAIVFGLEAALRAVPVGFVRALGAGGLLCGLLIGAAPIAMGGAPFAFEVLPLVAGASGAALGEGALAVAFLALSWSVVASLFLVIAGRAPTLILGRAGDDARA